MRLHIPISSAGVKRNWEVDKLTEPASIYGVLRLDTRDILKLIFNKFKEAENEDNKNNVYIQRIRELRVKEGKVSLKEKLKEFTIN